MPKRIAQDWEELERDLHAAGVSPEAIESGALAIRPTAELDGMQRTFLFVAGHGGSIVRALNRVYDMDTMRQLRQLSEVP